MNPELAAQLYDDLREHRLEVVLVPSRDPDCALRGGMIRAVQSKNPKWYSEFCERYPTSRYRVRRHKSDTLIKRQHTLRALKMLAEGRNGTIYTERLTLFIDVMVCRESLSLRAVQTQDDPAHPLYPHEWRF